MARNYNFNDNAFGTLFSGSGNFLGSLAAGLDPTGIGAIINAFNGFNAFGYGDDFLGNMFFGNPDASTEAWNEVSGKNSQLREFEQQEYLMDKQNAYNDPSAQMQRMKAAGINPNLAAAGIAGAGNTSAAPSSVATNTQGAAQAAQQATNAAGTVADIVNKASEANARNELLEDEQKQIRANTGKLLEEKGLNHWSAKSIEERLPMLKSNDYADYYQKIANIEKTWAEYQNLLEQHTLIVEQCKEVIANTALLYSEEEVNKARKKLIDEQTTWQKQDNEFWELHGYRRGDPIDQSIRDCKANGKDPSFIGESLYEYQEKSQFAKESGSARASWNYRPSTPVEAASYLVGDVINGNSIWSKYVDRGIDGLKELRANHEAYKAFKDDYEEAKSDLYDNYKNAKRKYREYKHSGASDQFIGQLKNQMDDALKEYESFTEEAFFVIVSKATSQK